MVLWYHMGTVRRFLPKVLSFFSLGTVRQSQEMT